MGAREWADDLAVQACCDMLRRPIFIWHKELEQAAVIKQPRIWQPGTPFRPIYLCLDERAAGCEHYTPLVLPEEPRQDWEREERPVDEASREAPNAEVGWRTPQGPRADADVGNCLLASCLLQKMLVLRVIAGRARRNFERGE